MKKSILYIEDEVVQAKVFSRIIREETKDYDCEILLAKGGREALELLISGSKKDNIRLVLLDLSMYDISGFQMIEEIKKINPNLKIAVLSAREDKNIQEEAKKLGVAEYFVKGKSREELDRLRDFIVKSLFEK